MTPRRKNKGSVLIMVTVALVGMFAIMGLAVDLGWAYFVKKSAQSAADAAAGSAISARPVRRLRASNRNSRPLWHKIACLAR